ncbi:MAG: glycosyltransferase family 2 protein [Ferruginibacter sp.]
MELSIISPVYKAEKLVDELVRRIVAAVSQITNDYEIILVEDGSPDLSWEAIVANCENHKQVTGIKLSRNFGQHHAISAGLDFAKGKWVVVMDCDLQDKPEEIINLYNKAQEGYEIVLAKRFERKDGLLKRFFSAAFYRTLGYFTGSEQDETVANFGIYHSKVISAIVSMRESIRYFPTMVKWVGFKSTKLNVEHNERPEGSSSYNIRRLINLALDIILAYSDKPIRLLIKTGLFISFLSLVITFYYIVKWLNGEIMVLGFTSLIISVWLLSGVIISTLGIVGLYLGKTFEGVKKRPIYLIKEIVNDQKQSMG